MSGKPSKAAASGLLVALLPNTEPSHAPRSSCGHCQVVEAIAQNSAMKKSKSFYHGHRFAAEIISCALHFIANNLPLASSPGAHSLN